MADTKTTDLAEVITLADGDIIEVVDVSDTSMDPAGTSKYSTRANFLGVEGTFTPTLAGSTTPGLHTYSVQNGNYKRIGNVVFFRLRIVVTTLDTWAGNLLIDGLPVGSAALGASVSIGQLDQFAYGDMMTAYVAGATSTILFRKHTSGTANSSAAMTVSDVGTTPAIRVSGMYFSV